MADVKISSVQQAQDADHLDLMTALQPTRAAGPVVAENISQPRVNLPSANQAVRTPGQPGFFTEDHETKESKVVSQSALMHDETAENLKVFHQKLSLFIDKSSEITSLKIGLATGIMSLESAQVTGMTQKSETTSIDLPAAFNHATNFISQSGFELEQSSNKIDHIDINPILTSSAGQETSENLQQPTALIHTLTSSSEQIQDLSNPASTTTVNSGQIQNPSYPASTATVSSEQIQDLSNLASTATVNSGQILDRSFLLSRALDTYSVNFDRTAEVIQFPGNKHAPLVFSGLNHLVYTEGQVAQIIDPAIRVLDSDQATLVRAEIKISAGMTVGDQLSFIDTANITSVWNPGTGTLILQGTATIAEYQSALELVRFDSVSHNPTSNSDKRIISWSVDDGTALNNVSLVSTSVIDIAAINDAPNMAVNLHPPVFQTLTNHISNFVISRPIQANDAISVADPDSAKFSGAQIQISGGFLSGDILSFSNTTNITGHWDQGSGTLTLVGLDTKANYQLALNSIDFSASSSGVRALTWDVTDSLGAHSSPVVSNVSVQASDLGSVTEDVYAQAGKAITTGVIDFGANWDSAQPVVVESLAGQSNIGHLVVDSNGYYTYIVNASDLVQDENIHPESYGDSGVKTESFNVTYSDTYGNPHALEVYFDINGSASVAHEIATSVGGDGAIHASGNVVDGYIAGAIVFADANNDGYLDKSTEAWTTTDDHGRFTLVGGTGNLVMIGGTDVTTGVLNKAVLSAIAGSRVVTPLTTLINNIVSNSTANGATLNPDEAASKLALQLGLSADVNLSVYDPTAAALTGDPNALKVFAAGVQVQNTIVQAAALLGSATGNSVSDATRVMFSAFANSLLSAAPPADSNSTILSSGSVLSSMMSSAASTLLNANTVTSVDTKAAVLAMINTVSTTISDLMVLSNAKVNDAVNNPSSGDLIGSSLADVIRVGGGTQDVMAQLLAANGADIANIANSGGNTVITVPTADQLIAAVANATVRLPSPYGTIANDNTVNSVEAAAGVAITGLSTPNSVLSLTITSNSSFYLTVPIVADANGNWSYTLSNSDLGNLGQGVQTIHATATIYRSDQTSSVIDLGSKTFTIDSVPPPVPSGLIDLAISHGYLTVNAAQVITGTAEAGNFVQIYDANILLASGTADANGHFTFHTSMFSEGMHSISATATNAVGSVSPLTTVLTFTVDTLAPLVSIDQVVRLDSSSGSVMHLSGTAETGTEVSVYHAGIYVGSTFANDLGIWTYDAPGVSESTNYSAHAMDAAGNVGVTQPFIYTIATDLVEDRHVVDGKLIVTGDVSGVQQLYSTNVTPVDAVLGSLVIDSSGHYVYSVLNSAVQYLGVQDAKVESFIIHTASGVERTLSFTIYGVNDAPALTAAVTSLPDGTEDLLYNFTQDQLLSGFTDADAGAHLSVVGLSADHGVIVDNGDGTYSLTEDLYFSGQVNLSYGVSDGIVTTHATQSVYLTPVQYPPVASGGVLGTGLEDARYISVTLAASDAANLNSGITGYVIDSLPTHGQFYTDSGLKNLVSQDAINTANATLKLYFKPDPNFNGNAEFTYHAIDTAGLSSSVVSAGINVISVNDPPVAMGGILGTGRENASSIKVTLSANDDADPNGGIRSYVIDSVSENGTLYSDKALTNVLVNGSSIGSIDTSLDLYFKPNANFSGDAIFTYHATDNSDASSVHVQGDIRVTPVLVPTVISGVDTGLIIESNTSQSVSGELSVTGEDGSTAFVSQSGIAGDHGYGLFSLNDAGAWSYTMRTAHDEFVNGQIYTDSIVATTVDGTSKVITVTMTGTNDAAVIGGTTRAAVTEAGGVNNGTQPSDTSGTATGTLTATDVDNPANTFIAVSTPTLSSGGYGRYTIDASGHWSYSVDNNHAAVQALNSGASLTDTFTVETADGTTQIVTVTVNGANDAALISGTTSGSMIESNVAQTVGGKLSATDVDSSAAFIVQTNAAGNNGYGKFSLTSAGAWTYTMNTAHNEFVNGQIYTDSVTATTADGTSQVITVTMTGTNDPAVITGTTTGSIIESNVAQTVGGTLRATDVDSSAAFVAQTNAAGSNNYGKFGLSSAGVWTYTMNTAHNEFVGGQTYTDSLTVSTADGTTQVITVTMTGTNDAAVIAGATTGSILESNLAQTTGGTLSATDVDSSAAFIAQTNAVGSNSYGKFSLSSAGVWTYTMNTAHNEFVGGQTYTDSLTATTADGTSQVITVTMTGTNDAAVISGTTSGAVTEAGGVNNGTQASGTSGTATGTLTDTDVDNPANTFTAVSALTASTHGYGSYTIDASGHWSYSLNNNNAAVQALNTSSSPLTDTFAVTTIDGTVQTVTITINGTNDAAVITGATTGSILESNLAQTTGGTLSATDVDSSAAFIAQTNAVGSNSYGKFSLSSAGVWTYTMNTAHNEFVGGQTYTDSFTATTADGTRQVVTVTMTGVNDAAVISGTTSGAVTEAGGVNNGTQASGTSGTATGTLTDTDVDNPANTFTAVSTPTVSAGGYGSYTIDASGHWSYSLNNNNATVQALNTNSAALNDSFTVTTIDGTAQKVSVTISGANDAPVVSNIGTAGGKISFYVSDVDNSTVSLNTTFNHAFGDPVITSGTTAVLVPTEPSYAISGVLQVTDGTNAVNVLGVSLGTSAAETLSAPVAGGTNILYGYEGADTLTGSTGNDTLVGGSGADILIGGGGVNTFVINASDSLGTVGGYGDYGTVSGYDVIKDFNIGVDTLDLVGTVLASTSSTANHSTLTISGHTINSDSITNGIINFDDASKFASPLTLNSTSAVAAAVQFLENNNIGAANSVVSFQATIGSVQHTYIYEQLSSTAAGSNSANSLLVDLQGVSNLNNLTTLIGTRVTPVAIDLNGNGVQYLSLADGVSHDYGNTGAASPTAWVAPTDGILALQNNDGSLQINFSTNTSTTDLQGISQLYDTNHDAILNASDAAFKNFGVWQDSNSNGVVNAGEFNTLTQLGITSISLTSTASVHAAANGDVTVYGQITYTMADGKTGVAEDAAFVTSNPTAFAATDTKSLHQSNSPDQDALVKVQGMHDDLITHDNSSLSTTTIESISSSNDLSHNSLDKVDLSNIIDSKSSIHVAGSVEQSTTPDPHSTTIINIGGTQYDIGSSNIQLSTEHAPADHVDSNSVTDANASGNGWMNTVDHVDTHSDVSSVSIGSSDSAGIVVNYSGLDWTRLIQSDSAVADLAGTQLNSPDDHENINFSSAMIPPALHAEDSVKVI